MKIYLYPTLSKVWAKNENETQRSEIELPIIKMDKLVRNSTTLSLNSKKLHNYSLLQLFYLGSTVIVLMLYALQIMLIWKKLNKPKLYISASYVHGYVLVVDYR